MKLAWIDVREADRPDAVAEEAVHCGVHGIMTDDAALLATLPATVHRVGVASRDTDEAVVDQLCETADILVLDHLRITEETRDRVARHGAEMGALVQVDDQDSLDLACSWVNRVSWTVVAFKDPTKIPLEIVLAATERSEGRIVTVVHDLEEAEVVLGVLERGSDGVVLASGSVGVATELAHLTRESSPALAPQTLEVRDLTHVGLGDRVCVDMCSHLGTDEGILVGSYASGMVLVSSETHPLPYMPTRPFRVNAGGIHSYVLGPGNRTRYLSELGAGSEMLAVRTNGETRRVVVGRAKLETRPLLQIDAHTAGGTNVNLIVQDDWHVRVLGPQAEVHNVTSLAPGDTIAGLTPAEPRHVGYAVREFLIEK